MLAYIQLIDEGANRIEAVLRASGDLGIYTNEHSECMKKTARLNIKLVNVLQGNDTLIFGDLFYQT